jgi:uncharacterized protein
MSKFNGCLICLVVVASPLFIHKPILAAPITMNQLAEPYQGRILVAQSPSEANLERDEVLDDIGLNRVGKLKGFLDRGGNVNDYLHAAINAGTISAVKMMLDRGANVNLVGEDGLTPVMISARVTYRVGVEMTALLIKKGANVNATASKGSTPLMFASWGVATHYQDEYVKVVRLLIKNGAKVNVKNQTGDTPLSIAKSGNWNKIVTVLKKAGAKA